MNAQAEQIEPEKVATAKGRKVNLPLRLSPEVHDSLRRIAFERRISIHALLMEGVADVLQRYGK